MDEKEALRKAFLEDQEIVDLLMNTGDNVTAFEHVSTGSKSPANKRIKKHFYVPGTTSVDGNFISMRGHVAYADSTVIKRVDMTVYVICNEDQMDLLQGSRADLLADRVDRLVNNWSDTLFGYGGIKLLNADEVQFVDGYSGWEIAYTTCERNMEADRIG